ncbi:MAG: ribosomal-protein-alanine N-acetyltransferase [Candidatus Magnetoglobus multicellularis str. Araruama]|uniref:Ribosomal-protein-alanine N-acetyltransferase n=1 Tax=Candidatus Magnetoglobus multicellularis str. Araruama TaxID=890399 RepID=A0A1V1PHL2_9BACT|nr:MAG: ribosomal-protein-alanine N-acetyltransferase [Candidatus Magnetoglobus multicellularis str. Araruama]
MSLNFRGAKIHDLPDILHIEKSIEVDHAANRHTLVDRLNMFPDGFRVVTTNQTPVGYIESCVWNIHSFDRYEEICQFSKFHSRNGTILFIIFVGVAVDFQNMGIGSLLLNDLISIVNKQMPHIQRIQLVSKEQYVDTFYGKNGFTLVKRLPDYLPEYGGVLMEKCFPFL